MRSHRLKFRKSQRSDMSALLMLTKQLYPTYGWTDEFMQWQYFNNPAGEAHIWMCFDGNNPVGSVVALPHVVRMNSQKVIGYRIQSVLTHPDYRGLSIYRRLSELCYEFLDSDNTSINFTFPNEKSDKVFRTSGWTPIGEIPLWISKPEDNNIVNLTPKYQLIRKFSSSEKDIWDLYRGQRILGIEKNPAFLNWRYFDNPNSKYHCYRIDRKARKLGKTVAFRSDILSDLNWHKMFPQLFRDFSHWKFYGYTKIRSKIESMINGSNPVHQTYSFNERTKWRDVETYVSNGVNVAIPFFDSKTLKSGIPDCYKGIKVIDGDQTDLRFTDPVGVIVGLKVKLPRSRSNQIATIKRSEGFFVGY